MERVQLVTRKRVALSKHGERTVRSNGEPEQLRFEFVPPLREQEDSVHAALGYSEWQSGRPRCSGWWEVRFKSTPDQIKLLWWADIPSQWYHDGQMESMAFDGTEIAFAQLEWRGLLKPDPRGYDYRVEGYYKARIPVVA